MTTPSTIPPQVQLALGRLFLMASRPEQSGDTDAYFACRAIIMEGAAPLEERSPSYAADYGKGFASQWGEA